MKWSQIDSRTELQIAEMTDFFYTFVQQCRFLQQTSRKVMKSNNSRTTPLATILFVIFLVLISFDTPNARTRPLASSRILPPDGQLLELVLVSKMKLTSANENTICGQDLKSGKTICLPAMPQTAETVDAVTQIFENPQSSCGVDSRGFHCWRRSSGFPTDQIKYIKAGPPESFHSGQYALCQKTVVNTSGKIETAVVCLTNETGFKLSDIPNENDGEPGPGNGSGDETSGSTSAPLPSPSPQPNVRLMFGELIDFASSSGSACGLEKSGADAATVKCYRTRWTSVPAFPKTTIAKAKQIIIYNDQGCVLTETELNCYNRNGPQALSNPLSPQDLKDAYGLRAGTNSFCLVLSGGRLHCEALPGSLQNDIVRNMPPALKSLGALKVLKIVGGYYHACVLLSDQSVQCWGSKTNSNISPPTDLGPIKDIAASDKTCAVTTSGEIKCWGQQASMPLKDIGPLSVALGAESSCAWNLWGLNCTNSALVSTPPLRDIISLSLNKAGYGANACALHKRREGYLDINCWGDEPLMAQVPDVVIASNPVDVVTGDGQACALTADYGILCWGKTPFNNAPTVVRDIKRISLGSEVGCMVDRFGLGCFGRTELAPTLAIPANLDASQVADVAMGAAHICALMSDATVQCWGEDSANQLKKIPVGLKNPTSIIAHNNYTCVSDDNGIKCWGDVPPLN
jgi:hypothetical protein